MEKFEIKIGFLGSLVPVSTIRLSGEREEIDCLTRDLVSPGQWLQVTPLQNPHTLINLEAKC